MDTALPQKFPFIRDRNLAKANRTWNRVCMSCDIVVLDNELKKRMPLISVRKIDYPPRWIIHQRLWGQTHVGVRKETARQDLRECIVKKQWKPFSCSGTLPIYFSWIQMHSHYPVCRAGILVHPKARGYSTWTSGLALTMVGHWASKPYKMNVSI